MARWKPFGTLRQGGAITNGLRGRLMRVFEDYEGRDVTLTDYREGYILARHYEIGVLGMYEVIGETLASPDIVVDYNLASHYYRLYLGTPFGDKYVHVVVVYDEGTRYVRTAYPAKRIVNGVVIWEREN